MTRRLALVSLCFGLAAIAGCGEPASAPITPAVVPGSDVTATTPPAAVIAEPASPAEKRGTIGYSALTLTNPFFQVIADNMESTAAAAGYDLFVVSGDNDVKKQADQINEFIVKGVAAIVLNPCDSKSIGPAIQKANAAGIPVFTNDIKYDGAEGKVVCHIATDNYQGGQLAGQALVKLLGESGGKVAVLHFPQVESCQLRVKGFTEVVAAHNAQANAPQIEIATTLDGGGARDAGYKAAKDAIEAHPDLAALFAINDPSALGARAALEAAGKADQVQIIAFDGQPIGKEAILAGKFLCEPVQFPDRIGKTTVEQLLQFFDGNEVPPEVLIPSELYYREHAKHDPELQQR